MKILLAVEDFGCAETVRKAVIAQFRTDGTELRLVHAPEPLPVGRDRAVGPRHLLGEASEQGPGGVGGRPARHTPPTLRRP